MSHGRPPKGGFKKGGGSQRGRGGAERVPQPLAAPKGELEPGLYVIATPIGNLGDITFRAVETLKGVDALACEDTRVTAKLLSHLGVDKPHPTFSCHEHNEARALGRVRSLIDEGRAVGLVSDAGLPGVSDPGYRMISTLLDEDVNVEVLPGPNAATMALVASGLPTSSFTFLGFPSRKGGKRKKMLEAERDAEHTLICYESPHRIGAFLADAAEVLGDRKAVVALELTKKFERYHRGTLPELAEEFAEDKPKGEITVLIEGLGRKSRKDGDVD
ncbi:16S rRNA (cytidine(1402)-2'-O)-methyltransferase [Magnetovibrio sp. PR-2]|uniref:16S rRNA (cytidine(1402)-2'-O)-methyltransferase n=1 Tax=Magnetovibrio sp. PR-2 TaxID=3120356 RepID=UPI002FCE0E36